MSSKRDPNRRVAMTAAQRGQLARLRVMHPRAMVRVNARQPFLPVVQITMRWRRRRVRFALLPDGRRCRLGGAAW